MAPIALAVRRLELRRAMSDWTDYDFIVAEQNSVERTTVAELTGWEVVRFELADEEPEPPAI